MMATHEIEVFQTGAAFLEAAEAWLLEEELARSLHFGLAQRHLDGKTLSGEPVFFSVVRRNDEIVLAAVRTPPMKVNLAGEADRVAAAALMSVLRERYPDLPGVFGPEELVADFCMAWRTATGDCLEPGDKIALHQLTELIPPQGVSGFARYPAAIEFPIVRAWIEAFHVEANPSAHPSEARISQILSGAAGETVWLWEDGGVPVCMCFTTRDTPNGRCIAGVYTPPTLRGRGYASGLVGAVSQNALKSGKSMPYLYTDVTNPTSNKIYAALGYECLGRLANVHFRR